MPGSIVGGTSWFLPAHTAWECSFPSRNMVVPGDMDFVRKRSTGISRMGVKDLSTLQLKEAPNPGGYERHFKHRGVLVSICWQNQNLGP